MVKKVTMPPRSSCPMDEPRAEIWNQRSTAEGFFRVFSGDNDVMAAIDIALGDVVERDPSLTSSPEKRPA